MGHKVQAQAGVTLADTYDTKGNQTPIELLEVASIAGVHEMGATIQSERFSTTIRRAEAPDTVQSADFKKIVDDLPSGVTRILGVTVVSEDPSELFHVVVSVRDPISFREHPIWAWETGDETTTVRIDDGGGIVSIELLLPTYNLVPQFLTGRDQPQNVPDIAFRGTTTAFGAGTTAPLLLMYIALAAIGGISSRGLPIPSW